ncbi:signal recognition particle-docking protein FtsY [Oligoflexia bacterium]|nr:signal recognition particle-docking protein FtsY [Oligoflexia bacterium]
MGFTEDILSVLAGISEEFGSGDATGVVVFLLFIGIIVFVLIGSFAFLRGRKPKKTIQSYERLSGVAGRVEKFEMDVNKFRTDTYRNLEFLKERVVKLEKHVAELHKKLGSGTEAPQVAEKGDDIGSGAVAVEDLARSDWDEAKVEEYDASQEAPVEEVVPPEPVEEADLDEDLSQAEEKPEEVAPESLSKRLKKTRLGLLDKIKSVFSSKPKLDEETLEELQYMLISSDLGVEMTEALIAELKAELSSGKEVDEGALLGMLKMKILSILEKDAPLDSSILPRKKQDGPMVVVMVGVNGVGKTTTVAKLASAWKEAGAKVLMVAADTFRAAAVEQLSAWGEKIGVPVVRGAEEAKPATVVYDAMEQAKADDVDVVIIDTAGRLHTKSNLMQELEGVRNNIERHQASAPHETILVLDGTTGQNAVSQAQEFNEAVKLTGLIVTKLDGTPKGGIVVAIKSALGIPVRYIGVGEDQSDLRPFVANDFVRALFDVSSSRNTQDLSAHAKKRRKRRDTMEYSR